MSEDVADKALARLQFPITFKNHAAHDRPIVDINNRLIHDRDLILRHRSSPFEWLMNTRYIFSQ